MKFLSCAGLGGTWGRLLCEPDLDATSAGLQTFCWAPQYELTSATSHGWPVAA